MISDVEFYVVNRKKNSNNNVKHLYDFYQKDFMNIDNVTLNCIYKIIFDELTILEFKSLTKLQQHFFIRPLKSRAHFLILDFLTSIQI